MMPEKMTITINCRSCKKDQKVKVEKKDYDKYYTGAFVQEAFPYLSADQRELFISQTCGPCFDAMFPPEED